MSRTILCGATAGILTLSTAAIARADAEAANVASNGVSVTLIGIAIGGMTWLTHVARQMARERAVRERVKREHGIELEYEVELWRANEPKTKPEVDDTAGDSDRKETT